MAGPPHQRVIARNGAGDAKEAQSAPVRAPRDGSRDVPPKRGAGGSNRVQYRNCFFNLLRTRADLVEKQLHRLIFAKSAAILFASAHTSAWTTTTSPCTRSSRRLPPAVAAFTLHHSSSTWGGSHAHLDDTRPADLRSRCSRRGGACRGVSAAGQSAARLFRG